MNIKINEELNLKSLELGDSEEIFNIINSQREYLGKWLPFVQYTTKLEDTKNWINKTCNSNNEDYNFSIQKNRKLIGLISLKIVDSTNKKAEIGYWISEKYQKQGIVTMAVKSLLNFAFNDLSFNKISIKCAKSNHSSKSIPNKLNFKFEGIDREGELFNKNEFRDLEIYSLLKNEFDKN